MASGRRVANPQDLLHATLVALVSDFRFTDLLGTTRIFFDEAFDATVSDFRTCCFPTFFLLPRTLCEVPPDA
jgi:hypothetical protein